MIERSITDYANEAVKQLATVLQLYPQLADATLEVQVEGDDLAIINLDNDALYVEVELKEVPTIGRTVLKPKYRPGYYIHHAGGYHNPPEVEDRPMLECDSIIQAACQLVGQEFFWRADNALYAEEFVEVEGIFEESA